MRPVSFLPFAIALATALPAAAGPLIDADSLETRLQDSDLAIIDIRNDIDGGSLETFAKGHVPGAVYSNYLQAGWRTVVDGVVGMTPGIDVLEALIGNLGIGNDDDVVIVHGGVGPSDFGSAARVYWTFRYLGHDRVSILDGGYNAWIADPSRPLETGAVTDIEPEIFDADIRPGLLVSTEEVAASLNDPKTVRIDARPEKQYRGEEKHGKALAAGRIPGSIGVEQAVFFGDDGRLLPREVLESLVPDAVSSGEADLVISYCNTGHWAATNWFVLSEMLGYHRVRLYDGSMTGWTADVSRPVSTGADPLDVIGRWLADPTG
ncbi:MAG: sulfurtransferase [Geminicoccaceae bacterium]